MAQPAAVWSDGPAGWGVRDWAGQAAAGAPGLYLCRACTSCRVTACRTFQGLLLLLLASTRPRAP